MTEPATPAELDGIIADLLADAGPPLMVAFTDGRTMRAGSRPVSDQARERAEAVRLEQHHLRRVLFPAEVVWRPIR